MTHQGSLGVLQLELDFVPLLTKSEMLTDESVTKHLTLERKFESESLQKFLEYAN